MADTYTKIADLIDPEVMGDMVSARIPKKLRVAPFAKVDDTLCLHRRCRHCGRG